MPKITPTRQGNEINVFDNKQEANENFQNTTAPIEPKPDIKKILGFAAFGIALFIFLK